MGQVRCQVPPVVRVQVTESAWYRFRRSFSSERSGTMGAHRLEYRVIALPFQRIVYNAATVEAHVRPSCSSVRPNDLVHVLSSTLGLPFSPRWS